MAVERAQGAERGTMVQWCDGIFIKGENGRNGEREMSIK